MSASRLKVQADLYTQFGYFWMIILAIYWCSLFLTSPQGTRDGNIKVLIVATGFSVAVAAWRWGHALADGTRVLGALPLPRVLWNAWLLDVLRNISARWGLAVLAGTIALSLEGATWHWTGAAFLYSAILTLGMIASLSHYGVWHWAWSACIALGVTVLIAFIGWHGIDQFLQAPLIWHLPVALSWLLLAVFLACRWRDEPPRGVAARRRTQFNLWQRWTNYAKRYTRLNPAFLRAQSKNGGGAPIFAAIVPMVYLFVVRAAGLNAQWGSQAGLLYIGSLILLAIFASAMLVCRDLHWRRLLAPNGFSRGRLGWHIIASTLTAVAGIVFSLVACLSVVLMFFAWGRAGFGPADFLKTIAAYSALPLELVLVVCAGVVLRGTPQPLMTSSLVLLAFFAASIAAFLMFGMKAVLGFFIIGPSYVVCLLLAIGAAIMLANRLWTTQRLLPYIVANVPENDDAVEGGRWFFRPGRPYQ